MAPKRMLVDATHPEETRVVVSSGSRLDEFDFESASRRQLRGNIYLAKVTRVEPSLQAAFIEYGGNRHGFLALSEIHPDYYQIPAADREALKRDEEAQEQAQNRDDDAAGKSDEDASSKKSAAADADTESVSSDGDDADAGGDDATVESIEADDALEELPRRRPRKSRSYKIQEVIKRRQVVLVQVVKEERGNKGAALTTYLSLAGRYSVLMPNTARGGGISRKITNATDRKRLKEIAGGLDVPKEMGVILRTAGAARTKAEVKRDFEYLLRLWENVRSLTLSSSAPALIYQEGSLIKRSIRDLYNKDISEVLVAGEDAYKEAKDFMRMIMPSHAKHVKLHKEDQPIFARFNVESQLDSMFSPRVTLPSGGYIIINPTEALVSIDVNSGKSTREHNIEDTALQTNLEAADEVARQLRLRDLAGLIVIDFIDMEEKRNNRNVERRVKDALKHDRARIQVGRISHFGLMEMSRQRIRFGLLEGSTHTCPHCQGTGLMRSVESLALMVMRAAEDHVQRRPGQSVTVTTVPDVALYILNVKRSALAVLEERYDLSIQIAADASFAAGHFTIERADTERVGSKNAAQVPVASASMDETTEDAGTAENDTERGTGRRRRRGGRRDREEPRQATETVEADGDPQPADAERAPANGGADDEDDQAPKRRRRGRRGGRRNRRGPDGGDTPEQSAEAGSDNAEPAQAAAPESETHEPETGPSEGEKRERKPARSRRTRGKPRSAPAEVSSVAAPVAEKAATQSHDNKSPASAGEDVAAKADDDKKPAKPRRSRKKPTPDSDGIVVTSSSPETKKTKPEDPPKKGGWWQRGFF
ncbi:MAG: Rne/Rng family ribonuclease [Alphaproteobacteria bacterium]|nr:Rne/Rng family ribonuclease [Alphaproteobacteria bacterium]